MVAQALANLLPEHYITIATNCEEALQELRIQKFDYAFVEIVLGDENGIALIKPLLLERVKPIMVSGAASIGQIRACIRLCAYGFVDKRLDCSHFLEILEMVETGSLAFPLEIIDELRQNPALEIPRLPRSEKRLLDYFIFHAEQTNSEIGENLCLSEGRIRNCMTALMRKFDATGRANLCKEAILRGYFPGIDTTMQLN